MSIQTLTYLSENVQTYAYVGIPDSLHVPYTQSAVPVSASYTVNHEEHARLPVLVYCRGGIGRVGMSRIAWIQEFTKHGFLVVAPWYRGTYNAEGRDEFGGGDVEDVRAIIRWVKGLPFVNPESITVMGFSRGTVNATLAVAALPDIKIRNLVLWGGISRLDWVYEERVDLRKMFKRVIGSSVYKSPELYAARSPIQYALNIPCPTLVMHSTHDVQVPFRHALEMTDALRQAGRTFTQHFYEGYGHHFSPEVFSAVVHRMVDWIRDN